MSWVNIYSGSPHYGFYRTDSISSGCGTRRGKKSRETLFIDLNQLLQSTDERVQFALQDGDNALAPKAGSGFVEGAVAKPGGYAMRGDSNVLKALPMAGGVNFEAIRGNI